MRFVLLLIAAVIAIVAGIVALQMSGKTVTGTGQIAAVPAVQPQSGVSTVDVLVARAPIPVGTVIDNSMVDTQPWPEHLVLNGFIVSGSPESNLAGKVARAPLEAREPFTTSKLANPNDPSFLAATLPSGMRAVTVATDAIAGVAGYVFPGDRIDVLLTHNVPQELRALTAGSYRGTGKPAVSEILAANIRVLAVNVRAPAGKESAQNTSPSSLTLEVSDEQAQKLRLAEKIGTLSVTLRSLKDRDNDGMISPTRLENLSRLHIGAAQDDSVHIVRGVGRSAEDMGSIMLPQQPVMITEAPMQGAPASEAPGQGL